MSGVFVGVVSEAGTLTLDHRAAFLAYAKRFAGDEVEVELRKRRTKRSDRQNRALHAMLTPWANGEGWPIDDLKRELLCEVFGRREVTSPVTGQITYVPQQPHTSALTTVEFALLMDRAVEIAAGCGVVLELPDEYRAAKRTRAA